MPGEIDHLEPVEDRELNGLFGPGWQESGRLVELLDCIDRREIRAAELGEPPAEGEPGADPADQPDVGEGIADVRDRGLRHAQTACELTWAGRLAGPVGQHIEDRAGARHGWSQRLDAPAGQADGFFNDGHGLALRSLVWRHHGATR